MSMSSSPTSAGCCRAAEGVSGAGLWGDGEFGLSVDVTAARFGIVWGLPKAGGKKRAPFGGSAWQGVLGGDGETGAFRLLLVESMGVISAGGLTASWVFMCSIGSFPAVWAHSQGLWCFLSFTFLIYFSVSDWACGMLHFLGGALKG